MTAAQGRILDISAVTELGTGRTVAALAYRANQRGVPLAVPAAAYAAALAGVDEEEGRRIGRASALFTVLPLEADAAQVGALARELRMTVPVAHVAHAARTRGWPIITSAHNARSWHELGFTADPLP